MTKKNSVDNLSEELDSMDQRMIDDALERGMDIFNHETGECITRPEVNLLDEATRRRMMREVDEYQAWGWEQYRIVHDMAALPEGKGLSFDELFKLAHRMGLLKPPPKMQCYPFNRKGKVLSGRPYGLAVLSGDDSEFEVLRAKFREIITELSGTEGKALYRALGYSVSTFLQRRYGHRDPKLEEVVKVIKWYEDGKPMEYHQHGTMATL